MTTIDYNKPAPSEITRSMGDDETAIQLVKVALGVLGLAVLAFGFFHLNKNLVTQIEHQRELIEVVRSKK